MHVSHNLPRNLSSVVPVVTIEKIEHALPLAQALFSGGASAIEVTLRTECALEAVRVIKEVFTDALIGIGTILTLHQYQQAVTYGADFIVSPGLSKDILTYAAAQNSASYIPGVATASEVIKALSYGFTLLKLFPAQYAGGIPLLQSFIPLFPNVQFFPTGGIQVENFRHYLALDNVRAVGGSWVAPKNMMQCLDWVSITENAKLIYESDH